MFTYIRHASKICTTFSHMCKINLRIWHKKFLWNFLLTISKYPLNLHKYVKCAYAFVKHHYHIWGNRTNLFHTCEEFLRIHVFQTTNDLRHQQHHYHTYTLKINKVYIALCSWHFWYGLGSCAELIAMMWLTLLPGNLQTRPCNLKLLTRHDRQTDRMTDRQMGRVEQLLVSSFHWYHFFV